MRRRGQQQSESVAGVVPARKHRAPDQGQPADLRRRRRGPVADVVHPAGCGTRRIAHRRVCPGLQRFARTLERRGAEGDPTGITRGKTRPARRRANCRRARRTLACNACSPSPVRLSTAPAHDRRIGCQRLADRSCPGTALSKASGYTLLVSHSRAGHWGALLLANETMEKHA